ncbi:RNA binding protein [Liquorilactobacillus sucicola DSM 21376 = JCM 15457]|nr:RNA binding protein [Liquorilactobacillus sucicola DSM 21376 = JCM 15457]
MRPLFQIGKDGINPVWIEQVKNALNKRELIKVNLLQSSPLEADEAHEYLENKTDIHVVQEIGHILVLYRQSENKENRAISNSLKEL